VMARPRRHRDPARRLGTSRLQHAHQQNMRPSNQAGQRSSRPARTDSTPSAASTPSSAELEVSTTPALASWSTRAGSPGHPRTGEGHLPRPPASSAATTRSTPRRAPSSNAVPAPPPPDAPLARARASAAGRRRPHVARRAPQGNESTRNALTRPSPSTRHRHHRLPYCMVMLGDASTPRKRRQASDPRGHRRAHSSNPRRQNPRRRTRPVGPDGSCVTPIRDGFGSVSPPLMLQPDHRGGAQAADGRPSRRARSPGPYGLDAEAAQLRTVTPKQLRH